MLIVEKMEDMLPMSSLQCPVTVRQRIISFTEISK